MKFAISGVTFTRSGRRNLVAQAENGERQVFDIRDFAYASDDRSAVEAARGFLNYNPR
jgi:hypothetical protein